MKKFVVKLAVLVSMLVMGSVYAVAEGEAQNGAEQFNYAWVEGGKSVEVQKGLASINLDKDLLFLDKNNTIICQKNEFGNEISGKEIGSIYPADENKNWYVVMEYDESGYVKDNEKIDAKDLLKSYQEGQKEYNKQHPEKAKVDVAGWEKEPYYDKKTNNLAWSVMYKNDTEKTTYANHNVKVLTRKGFVSFILVANPTELTEARKVLDEKIIPKFAIETGNRYSDFNASTDKIAEYGVAGLILGGVALGKGGIIAALLAMKKLLVVAVAAIVGGIAYLWKLITGKKNNSETE